MAKQQGLQGQGAMPLPPMLHDPLGRPIGRVPNNTLNAQGLQEERREMSNLYRDGGRPYAVTGMAPFRTPPQQQTFPGGVERNRRTVGGSEYMLKNPQVGDLPTPSMLAMGGSMQQLPRQGNSQAALKKGIDGSGTVPMRPRGMNMSYGGVRGAKGKTGPL